MRHGWMHIDAEWEQDGLDKVLADLKNSEFNKWLIKTREQ